MPVLSDQEVAELVRLGQRIKKSLSYRTDRQQAVIDMKRQQVVKDMKRYLEICRYRVTDTIGAAH